MHAILQIQCIKKNRVEPLHQIRMMRRKIARMKIQAIAWTMSSFAVSGLSHNLFLEMVALQPFLISTFSD